MEDIKKSKSTNNSESKSQDSMDDSLENEFEQIKNPADEKYIEIKEAEYLKLVNEVKEFKDKYMRLYAEFDNARKRMDREKQEFIKYANEGLIIELLGVLDSLELSMKAARDNHNDYEAFLKGIEMVMANTYEILKKNGVKPIKALGQPFDPHCHEVLMQEDTDEHDDGIVLEEFQKGYQLGERVIRTVKVKTARRKSENK